MVGSHSGLLLSLIRPYSGLPLTNWLLLGPARSAYLVGGVGRQADTFGRQETSIGQARAMLTLFVSVPVSFAFVRGDRTTAWPTGLLSGSSTASASARSMSDEHAEVAAQIGPRCLGGDSCGR